MVSYTWLQRRSIHGVLDFHVWVSCYKLAKCIIDGWPSKLTTVLSGFHCVHRYRQIWFSFLSASYVYEQTFQRHRLLSGFMFRVYSSIKPSVCSFGVSARSFVYWAPVHFLKAYKAFDGFYVFTAGCRPFTMTLRFTLFSIWHEQPVLELFTYFSVSLVFREDSSYFFVYLRNFQTMKDWLG